MDDLISRSTLEAEFRHRADTLDKELGGDLFHISEIVMIIDNAPTVPLPDFKEGYKQAILDGKTNFSKPQGKWKKIGEEYYNWHNHTVIKCSHCGYVKDIPGDITPNFCEDCGADMRKGAEND